MYKMDEHKPFEFEREGKVYKIKALREMDVKEINEMLKIDEETEFIEKGEKIRDFILEQVPELKGVDMGALEYFDIYNAYALDQGGKKAGES